MGDYDLTRLEPRSFEQLIQALAVRVLGPSLIVFGDGPDGGREATYQGRMSFRDPGETWDGYLVVQAKFRQRPLGTSQDGDWALGQLRKEFEAFAGAKGERRKPEYFILATNVVLSPVGEKGFKDKASDLIESYRNTVPLKGYAFWDFDQLRTYLDGYEDVRRAFAAFVTPGDVLAKF